MFEINFEGKGNIEVHFVNSWSNPCIHIENSHIVTDKTDILKTLNYIHNTDEYKKLLEIGYKRTLKSEFYEWVGHNVLYRFGILKKRTGSVDIDNNEPIWRRIVYAFLSLF